MSQSEARKARRLCLRKGHAWKTGSDPREVFCARCGVSGDSKETNA